jgi:hypothetical protein
MSGLSVTNDYIISSFLNPVGTATYTGRTLFVTGVRIATMNAGATSAATPLVAAWCLQFGHNTTAAGNQAESATAKAPRRMVLGNQYLPLSSVIGIPFTPDINVSFQTPIMVMPGEYCQTVMRLLSYATAASQVAWVTVSIDGYWE